MDKTEKGEHVERSDPVLKAVVIGDVPAWLDAWMRGDSNTCKCFVCSVSRGRRGAMVAAAVEPEPLAEWERELLAGVRAEVLNRAPSPWEL
ncbi:hypothetical protein SEA_THUNDERCLAP_88 [Arthrobacter phage Thunderclap]|uniref:Uncharacterized protein n=1 Tax=Arthrobacter phage Thunderclap TaxID=2777309 RepID=A0A7M1RQE5_9CAUD|nr:hypothetical protein SEA_THUNDERCLAP_88 [Arthrobacter phage Thunderclap]